jgi:hypothetical protein
MLMIASGDWREGEHAFVGVQLAKPMIFREVQNLYFFI